jgi:hypothetical protein
LTVRIDEKDIKDEENKKKSVSSLDNRSSFMMHYFRYGLRSACVDQI